MHEHVLDPARGLRIVRMAGARESIATSGGQNDSGLFELNFHDDRYLPFEFQGAVSRWRIEMPREDNYFHFRYADRLRVPPGISRPARGATRCAKRHARSRNATSPGNGWCLFDACAHDFPDAWAAVPLWSAAARAARRSATTESCCRWRATCFPSYHVPRRSSSLVSL